MKRQRAKSSSFAKASEDGERAKSKGLRGKSKL